MPYRFKTGSFNSLNLSNNNIDSAGLFTAYADNFDLAYNGFS
jgi:hypothetical protein